MAITVNLKVYLIKENAPSESISEIRKCTVEYVNDAVNFTQLYEKIQDIFPDIKGQCFTVAWKDSDDDYITISSNEELKIALSEMQSSVPICKLYVTLHMNKRQESNISIDNFNVQNNVKVKHLKVICDICNKDIIGFRYKCIQCLDYDLCSDCEGKGHHAGHCVLRLPVPLHYKMYYGKRLLHHINKFIKKASTSSPEEEVKECPYKNRCTDSCSDHQTPTWADTFTTHLLEWANFIGELPLNEHNKKEKTHSNKNSDASDSTNVHTEAENFSETANAAEENNSKINNNEQDVNDVKQSNELDHCKEVSNALDHCKEVSNALHNEMESKLITDAENLKIDDWTLLEKDSIPSCNTSLSSNSNKQATSSITQDNTKISNNELLYPVLPKDNNNIPHENPIIQNAIETMLWMGFSNENGWLTKLLVLADGNINSALDMIHNNSASMH